jgi:hypothetical protein
MVEEYALGLVLGRLGPAGTIIRDLLRQLGEKDAEIADLKAKNRRLEATAQSTQTLKRRSPAHWSFHVLRWDLGEQTFYPKEFPQGKTGPNLRVYIPLEDQSEGAPYWDITRKRIIDRLLPLLPMIVETRSTVEITQVGDGPTSDQVITIRPP